MVVSFNGHDDIAPVTSLEAHRSARESEPGSPSTDEPAVTTEDLEDTAVRAIGRRGLSEREVADLVRDKGGDADQEHAVLERMRELHYVDDSRIAEEMVHRLAEGRGKTRAVVAREMSARGIPSDVIDGALATISDDTERSAAIELALKRGAQLASADDDAFARRLTGYLARRGYPSDIVREAVAAAKAERGSRVRFR